MVRKIEKTIAPVSIVIVHRNSSSTILKTLAGIKKQDYPIREIIIVDNHSTDESLSLIKKFSTSNKSLCIKILAKNLNTGISNSYNMGVKTAKSNHVIIMQADGVLPSRKEISIIMEPVFKENNVSACTPFILMPMKVWSKYNFWEKCMFCPALNENQRSFTGKFNYINKKLFLKAGGFDERNFNFRVGGEDVDLTIRLKKAGKVVETNARVIHLHYLGKNYSVKNWVINRKLLTRAYGKIVRMHKSNLPLPALLLLVKPFLAFFSLMIFIFPYNFLPIIVFALVYMRVMYTTKETLKNPRIILLPFISIALIYYETFWMLKEFFVPIKKWEGIK